MPNETEIQAWIDGVLDDVARTEEEEESRDSEDETLGSTTPFAFNKSPLEEEEEDEARAHTEAEQEPASQTIDDAPTPAVITTTTTASSSSTPAATTTTTTEPRLESLRRLGRQFTWYCYWIRIFRHQAARAWHRHRASRPY